MASARQELQTRTREAHSRLELSPGVQALLSDAAPPDAYVGLLRATTVIYEAADRLFSASSAQPLRELSKFRTSRTEELQQDLNSLNADRFRVDAAALLAQLFVQRLRLLVRTEPMALVGVAYVLESGALAAALQLAHVRSRPQLRENALAQVLVGGALSAIEFQEFERKLESCLTAPADVDAAVLGANETFSAFENVLRALGVTGLTRAGSTLLNVDAGEHALPEDLREVEAALRAGEITWEKYGYYDARFGERGRSFTRSDSAWLAALCSCEPSLIVQEIRWLGSVLAHRGMPRYLLEDHLGVLHEELCRALPTATQSYAGLLSARDALREERQQHLEEASLLQLARQFEAVLPRELVPRLHGSGVLPAAAVLDEACGLSKAVASLESWWHQEGRVPEAVRVEFDRAVTAARRAVRSSPTEIQLN